VFVVVPVASPPESEGGLEGGQGAEQGAWRLVRWAGGQEVVRKVAEEERYVHRNLPMKI
jgi:hypothetical protein